MAPISGLRVGCTEFQLDESNELIIKYSKKSNDAMIVLLGAMEIRTSRGLPELQKGAISHVNGCWFAMQFCSRGITSGVSSASGVTTSRSCSTCSISAKLA
ncbi:MAG: hypothetical protein ONB44_19145 [candidate division KSB1 bacterium]|nr:hypothetical protein [candidate division KSB1 bacterium]MDZ7304246.1 hypothetical protein [candidate division KSB1 bacterium]MDZ7311721.1 hypothetical protein [candidate division KSB1 bacterium]